MRMDYIYTFIQRDVQVRDNQTKEHSKVYSHTKYVINTRIASH